MTEQTETPEAFITTNHLEIFGREDIVQLDINAGFIEQLLDNQVAYVSATTVHMAKLELISRIVSDAHKIGVKRLGELAIAEIKKQGESNAERV